MSPVDCESFRSHSIGLPFCFKLPAYPPLLSSPAVPIHRVSRISPLYLSLYPRIASAPIITALKEYTRRVIPALCEDSHRSVYVYSSSLPPLPPLSLFLVLHFVRLVSHPLAAVPPLFPLAAAHCLSPQFLRLSIVFPLSLSPLSSFSPTCSFRRSQSTLLRAPLSSALRSSLLENSPCRPSSVYFWTIRRNGSTTPFAPPNWDAYVCADRRARRRKS